MTRVRAFGGRVWAPVGLGWMLALFLGAAPAAWPQSVALDGTFDPSRAGFVPRAAGGSPYTYEITEDLGIRNGRNLFHSFDRFGLEPDERAHFSGSAGIENVIARVTGMQASTVEGVISADPWIATSAFFLVNPKGITFLGDPDRQRAHLELPGSFYGSTADRLLFGSLAFESDGVGGNVPVELDVAPTGWGFDPGDAQTITAETTLPLDVVTGATLSLVGGDVEVTNAAKVEAFGGSLEFGAVGERGAELPLDLSEWRAEGEGLGEVRFVEDAFVRAGNPAAGGDQGRLVIRGGRLVVDDSLLQAGGNAGAGTLAIDVQIEDTVQIRNRGRVLLPRRDAVGPGDGRIEARSIEVDGAGSFVFAQAIGGDATTPRSQLELEADSIEVTGGAFALSDAADGGDGVDLVFQSDSLLVDDGRVATRARGDGSGGALTIAGRDGGASTSILAANGGEIESEATAAGRGGALSLRADLIRVVGDGSRIGSETTAGGGVAEPPSGGDLHIAGGRLELVRGGQIEGVTLGGRAGGQVEVVVDAIEIEGGTLTGTETGIFSTAGRSLAESSTGDAGGLRIEARTLDIRGARSAISTRSFGDGDAGRLQIEARDSITLQGDESGAPVVVASAFGGDGGGVADDVPSLSIVTDHLELRRGAALLSSALSSGDAGDIEVVAEDVVIAGRSGERRSSILSEAADDSSAAGDGGQVRIHLTGDLELVDDARISVITRGPGVSGGIEIQADGRVRVADGAAITSDAEVGRAAPQPEAAGSVIVRGSGGVSLRDGEIRARGIGAVDAGDIVVDAGPELVAFRGAITSEAVEAAGGNITIRATELVSLRESRVATSVLGAEGVSDAGNIDIDPRFVVLDTSEVVAQARRGDGGNIRIVTDRFLASSDSLVDASSEAGIDGAVVVEGPDDQLKGELTRLPSRFLDASRLLGERCAARTPGQGSLVLGGPSGAPVSPARPLASPMPLPEDLAHVGSGIDEVRVAPGPDPCGQSFDHIGAEASR